MSNLGGNVFRKCIESMADLSTFPGYKFDVDPELVKPEEILEPYATREEMVCAIVTCHHKHRNGFVVRMADDSVTNFGKDCGRRHFGEEFSLLTKKFSRLRALRDENLAIDAFRHRAPTMLAALEELIEQDRGIRWLQASLNSLHVALPPKTYQELLQMAHEGREAIFVETRRSDEELAFIRATSGEKEAVRQRYAKVEVARIRGISLVTKDPRRIAIERLKTPLQLFLALPESQRLYGNDRKAAVSLVREADRLFEECGHLLKLAKEFFVPDHVVPLKRLAATVGEDKLALKLKFDIKSSRFV